MLHDQAAAVDKANRLIGGLNRLTACRLLAAEVAALLDRPRLAG